MFGLHHFYTIVQDLSEHFKHFLLFLFFLGNLEFKILLNVYNVETHLFR